MANLEGIDVNCGQDDDSAIFNEQLGSVNGDEIEIATSRLDQRSEPMIPVVDSDVEGPQQEHLLVGLFETAIKHR